MSRNRFAKPDITRLPLSDGDYVDIKKRLNHGEREDLFATIAPFGEGGKTRVDRRLARTHQVLAYLLGWSFTNDGTPIPYTPDMPEEERLAAIRGLDTSTFDEVFRALQTHVDTIDAEDAKNDQSAASASATT